jgi:hypothetical protein
MDTINPLYLVLALVILIITSISFWLISKKAPKGTLLAVAIAMWIIGSMIGNQPVREMKLIGGTIQTLGTIGVILGVIDLFRKSKTEKEK